MNPINDSKRKRSVIIGNVKTEILTVPWIRQPNTYTCFPVSIKMVIEYFKKYYGNPALQELRNISTDELIELCRTDPCSGTRIDEELMRELSSVLEMLKFELKKGLDFQDLKKQVKNGIPCIVIYDGRYIRYRLTGPAHAGVVIGFTPIDEIVFNNPWYGSIKEFKRKEFIDAWEIYENRAVFINPIPQSKLKGESSNA